jgi:hypothetical protein
VTEGGKLRVSVADSRSGVRVTSSLAGLSEWGWERGWDCSSRRVAVSANESVAACGEKGAARLAEYERGGARRSAAELY